METAYFFIFSVGIGGIIFWALLNDDQADFTGQKRDGKFSTNSKNLDTGTDTTETKSKR